MKFEEYVRRNAELSRNTIRADRFDREDYQYILDEISSFRHKREAISENIETAPHLWEDTFYAFMQADPKMHGKNNVMPKYFVNHAVMKELMSLPEYEELFSFGLDLVGAAYATNSMKDTLEEIFDRLQTEQELADQAQKKLEELADMLAAGADSSEIGQGKEEFVQLMNELNSSLGEASLGISAALSSGMESVVNDFKEVDAMQNKWGIEPGQIQRLPFEERLEFAKKFKSNKFKNISDLFGPLHRLAFKGRNKRSNNFESMHSIEFGDDLRRLLSTELALLNDSEDTEMLFYSKLHERKLSQYNVRGEDRLGKGGIIFLEDGSGSMAGQRNLWAKAVGLCLLDVARRQNRRFHAVHFGSRGQIATSSFEGRKDYSPEKIFDFGSLFFNGGTDFQTPLTHAIELLEKEHASHGFVRSDIVMVTDGECGISKEWLEDFKRRSQRIGCKVWAILIGVQSSTLVDITDDIFTIADLTETDQLKNLFEYLND